MANNFLIYNPDDPLILDFQDCGEPIRKLTQRQARMMAETPYEFIAYCPDCKKYHKLRKTQVKLSS